MSKTDDVFWRQFGVLLILLTVFGFAMYFAATAIGENAYAKMRSNPDDVAARIAPVGKSRIGDPAAQAQAPASTASAAAPGASTAQTPTPATETASAAPATDSGESSAAVQTVAAVGGAVDLAAGEKVYQSACFACHLTGAAGAPKIDDPAAWEPRLGQGMAGLVQSVTNGKGAMPPKGGFAHLTEDELRNAIQFMLDKAGVSADG